MYIYRYRYECSDSANRHIASAFDGHRIILVSTILPIIHVFIFMAFLCTDNARHSWARTCIGACDRWRQEEAFSDTVSDHILNNNNN